MGIVSLGVASCEKKTDTVSVTRCRKERKEKSTK